jgi:hypothetical protein
MSRTNAKDPKEWWRDALNGLKPVVTDEPHPGFYKRRLVKGGPFVPVQIWIEGDRDDAGELVDDERILCSVNGREADAVDNWMYCCVHPISEAEFDYLTSLSSFARVHAPREPLANPKKKIDPLKFPLPSFPQAKRKKP